MECDHTDTYMIHNGRACGACGTTWTGGCTDPNGDSMFFPGCYMERVRVRDDVGVWRWQWQVIKPGAGSLGWWTRKRDAARVLVAYLQPDATRASVMRARNAA